MGEAWFRNPHNYVRELAEVGAPFRVVWDRGMLVKKHIDPYIHAQIYFGKNSDWRILCIGPQGTAELDPDHSMKNPLAVYPTWAYGEDIDILEEMMANNIGFDPDACTADVPVDERPTPNQEHRVVVTNLPPMNRASSRPFYRELRTLHEDYPDCIVHIHSSYSFPLIFGQGFGSGDVEPRGDAANGRVILPSGKQIPFASTVGTPQWVNLLGFSVTDLKDPRNRCMFNIKSAQWAGKHWDENIKFKTRGSAEVDSTSPITTIPTTSQSRTHLSLAPQAGDKITCDTCSLADSCKYFRTGAVCSIPGTESNTLAKMFGSRDSSTIIDALGTVMGAATKRLEKGMVNEDLLDELDPEVTKIMNQIVNNGMKLAKLIDPSLTKPGVQVNVGGGAVAINAGTPNQLMGAVVRALEKQGYRIDQITPDMVTETLREMGLEETETPQIIQGQSS